MVAPARAAVVIVHFPFSDLSQTKLRPAVVLADAGRGDWLLCQITSNSFGDSDAVQITSSDFSSGSLRVVSFARPRKLFTASGELIAGCAGSLGGESFARISEAVVAFIRAT